MNSGRIVRIRNCSTCWGREQVKRDGGIREEPASGGLAISAEAVPFLAVDIIFVVRKLILFLS